MKVYCIIVTYNAMKWVDRCLTSLRESSIPVSPIIIDNCSKDNTIPYIRENYPEAYVIENSDNKGFGQANNQGIEYAYKNGATHFFLLNQDAWVQKDSIKMLVEVQDSNELAVVSPIQLNGAGDIIDSSFCRAAVFNTNNVELVTDWMYGTAKDYYPVISVPAASWMISRKTVDTIGGFDPLFFHYGEDSNYCQRLKYNKLTIAIVPSAYIHHDRLVKGNVEMFNKIDILRMLFLEYADINKRPFIINLNTFKLHTHLFFNLVKAIFTLNGKLLSNTWWTIKNFYTHIPDIRKSRKYNKVLQPNWLKV